MDRILSWWTKWENGYNGEASIGKVSLNVQDETELERLGLLRFCSNKVETQEQVDYLTKLVKFNIDVTKYDYFVEVEDND